MIILMKSKFAEEHLQSKSLGDKPGETLTVIAGYYFKSGLNKGQVKAKLEEFIKSCNPAAVVGNWSSTIDYAVRSGKKYPIVDIESIPVTEAELDIIDNLDGIMVKKLAFTLLILAKYSNAITKRDDSWVTLDDTEIMKMANITANMRKQSLLYHKLHEKELLNFSKKIDNTNVQVNYIKTDSPVVMEITDVRSLGNQYMKYTGAPYFVCECCGITTRINNPKSKKPQKYCTTCAKKIAAEQRAESVKRGRSNNN